MISLLPEFGGEKATPVFLSLPKTDLDSGLQHSTCRRFDSEKFRFYLQLIVFVTTCQGWEGNIPDSHSHDCEASLRMSAGVE